MRERESIAGLVQIFLLVTVASWGSVLDTYLKRGAWAAREQVAAGVFLFFFIIGAYAILAWIFGRLRRAFQWAKPRPTLRQRFASLTQLGVAAGAVYVYASLPALREPLVNATFPLAIEVGIDRPRTEWFWMLVALLGAAVFARGTVRYYVTEYRKRREARRVAVGSEAGAAHGGAVQQQARKARPERAPASGGQGSARQEQGAQPPKPRYEWAPPPPLALSTQRATHPLADLDWLAFSPDTMTQIRFVARAIHNMGRPGMPKGAIIYGPPGTGKTALVRALAARARVRFYAVTAGDLISMWAGESSQRIHALYEEAARNQPAVVYIDEGDALVGHRSQTPSPGGAATEHNRIVGQILAEIEGLEERQVFTVISTNLPKNLDPAFVSRLGLQVEVPLPGFFERARILRMAFQRTGLIDRVTGNVNVGELALASEGFSGRDLTRMVANALLLAEDDPEGLVSMTHFLAAAKLLGSDKRLVLPQGKRVERCVVCHDGILDGERCDVCEGAGYIPVDA